MQPIYDILPDNLKNFAPDDKVWVYTAENLLSEEQQSIIKKELNNFISNWESHGEKVNADYTILKNRFIIIAASIHKGALCGRAIDASVQFIKHLEKNLNNKLLNRMNIAIEHNNCIDVWSYPELMQKIEAKSLPENAFVFNPSVSTMQDLADNWKQPVYQSFLTLVNKNK
ncbi:MAG: hypothetical protein D6707_06595 [Bacteroidetes bacterium]|nr:MAG: hypothetical protein D6707_06595 [Bacteroidota bacterium]